MCLGNDKMKSNANMTKKYKCRFVCISPLREILHPKIPGTKQRHSQGEGWMCSAGTVRPLVSLGDSRGLAACPVSGSQRYHSNDSEAGF